MAKRRVIRKALTEQQKQDRRERLAKARAAKGPTEYKSIHNDVPRDPEANLSLYNVRKWILSNKEELASLKKIARKEGYDRARNTRINILTCYIENMESYLRNGVWTDMFYGENQQYRYRWRVAEPAYDNEGLEKVLPSHMSGVSHDIS